MKNEKPDIWFIMYLGKIGKYLLLLDVKKEMNRNEIKIISKIIKKEIKTLLDISKDGENLEKDIDLDCRFSEMGIDSV